MIDEKKNTRISKFLSLILRHTPEKIGLELDDSGWVPIESLLSQMKSNGQELDRETLDYVVANNSKKRFAFSEDGLKIRASQGHSIKIEHGYEACIPPSKLFHGTALRNEHSILKLGLDKRQRHHVHLSSEIETAMSVGSRHGKPIVFEVNAKGMHSDGHEFFKSENGVWLTERVPPKYLVKNENNG